MPISSVSKTFTPSDPVMETDLDLLAKVNNFEQLGFNQGAEQVQNEIDNWSMLSNVAKPQDRDYINKKLNNLVSGINNIGGVDLKDPNNVNAIKSLGYNVYGDNNITNAVSTTKKLQQLQQDIVDKSNGKNAKDYDPVVGNYLVNKYSDWLNDGKVGTSFEGPTELPIGTFNNYLDKVGKVTKDLTPDATSLPYGVSAQSAGYIQVGDKFIKKARYEQAIQSVTDANDMNVIKAHAWSQMRGIPDDELTGLQYNNYNSKIQDLQSQYNSLKAKRATTKDPQQQADLDGQMQQLKNGIGDINDTKQKFFNGVNGKKLDNDTRDGISTNLFYDAFVNQYSNAKAFDQNSQELKLNEPLAFTLKENRLNNEFQANNQLGWFRAKTDQDRADYEGIKAAYETMDPTLMKNFGITGPVINAPITTLTNTDNPLKISPQNTVQAADANLTNAQNRFYDVGMQYLVTHITDPNLNIDKLFIKNKDGSFQPKDRDSEEKIHQILMSKYNEINNLSNTPLEQRSNKSFGQDDLTLQRSIQDMRDAQLFKDNMKSVEDDVFKKTYGNSDLVLPRNQKITFQISPTYKTMYSYEDLNNLQENAKADPKGPAAQKLEQLKKSKVISATDGAILKQLNPNVVHGDISFSTQNSVDVFDKIKDYYDATADIWEKEGKDYKSSINYSSSLPHLKNGKLAGGWGNYLYESAKQSLLASGDKDGAASLIEDDMDLQSVSPQLDLSQPGKFKYIMNVKQSNVKDGDHKSGDKIIPVDITNMVTGDHPNPVLLNLFPKDNATAVAGMILNKNGYTPGFNQKNTLRTLGTNSIQYQIVENRDPITKQLNGFKVSAFIPGKNIVVSIPNPTTLETTLPVDMNGVQNTVNYWFQNQENIQHLLQINNVK